MAFKTIPPRKPTVQEVADKANVSRAAVYAVLNANRPTNIRISKEKAKQILRVADELGYVRNDLARSLSTGKTFTVGVSVVTLKTHFYTDFFTSLDDACYQDGYSVFIACSEYDLQRELRNLRAFQSKCVDAVVVSRRQPADNDEALRQLAASGIAVVVLGEVDVPELPFPAVGFDEPEVGRLVARHLWSLGHRRILYLDASRTRDGSLRIHQIRSGLFSQAWESLGGPKPDVFSTADTVHGGAELAAHLLSRPAEERPTAVACSTDQLAISLISALRMAPIRVPQDLSVIGCDDIDTASEAAVPLTTICLPTEQMAEGAWMLILGRLRASAKKKPERIVIAPELILRESTAQPAQDVSLE
jgi:LacI family transcriptional regulator